MSKKDVWRVEDHACRCCFGRVLSRELDDDGRRLYSCSNCGLEAEGTKVSVICACGAKLKREKGQADAGLRCHPNLARSPAFPSVIVCSFGGAQPESAS